MKYLKCDWIHNYDDCPYSFYNEIGKDNFEIRKIEFFKNGLVAYASKEIEYHTFLSEATVPSVEEINLDIQFKAELITQEEFEILWKKYVVQNIK